MTNPMTPTSFNQKNSNIFALFPGQGSQSVGMGKDLYDQFGIARETFEEASDSISIDLKKLCFSGPDHELILTENTQPCLLAASVASFRVAEKELGFVPKAAAGHSLGEYSALVALGCLELGSATRWVRERGLAMQKAVPPGDGTMAAILGIEDSLAEILCQKATEKAVEKRKQEPQPTLSIQPIVEPANYNAPGQIVIAGSTDAVNEALQLLKTNPDFAGGKAIPLAVSAPFHCQLMAPARKRMAELFAQASESQKPRQLKYPYIPNRTARLSQEPGAVFDLLVEQVDHPVLWKQSILTFFNSYESPSLPHPHPENGKNEIDPPFVFVEFGPGKVLSGLVKRIATQAKKPCSQISVNDTSTLTNLERSICS